MKQKNEDVLAKDGLVLKRYPNKKVFGVHLTAVSCFL